MNSAPRPLTFADLARLPSRGLITALLALMLITGLSEGIGILLLIPLIPVLETGLSGETWWGLPAALASFGPARTAAILLAGFIAIIGARALALYWRSIVALKVEIAIVDTLRARAVAGLLGAEWRTISAMRQSDNASLLITTIDRLSYAVAQGLSGLAIAVTIAVLLFAALLLAPALSFGAIVIGALILLAYRGFRQKAQALGTRLNESFRTIYSRMDDSLAGLRLIKSFGREEATVQAVNTSFQNMRTAQFDYVRASGWARSLLHVLGAILLAGFVWVAIFQFDQGAVVLVPLVALFGRSLMLLSGLHDAWQDCRHAAPALAELSELIATTQANQESQSDTARPIALRKAIRLDAVSVRYREGQSALSNVDLTINKGECIALSGPSGGGKSTLADILAGLLEPDSGTVSLDGETLASDHRKAWRNAIAYVQQDTVLFDGCIASNMRWAVPDASDQQIEAALEAASADFVHHLPHGLATEIGDKGHQLSGGERQRIALARALLHQPQLLILDEATSAVDTANERAIYGALAKLKGELTILVIGHRSGLEELADRRFELAEGRLLLTQD